MRIHSNNLTHSDILFAAKVAGVTVVTLADFGSRSRAHAHEIKLSGSSPHRTMDKEHQAASWDEWGIFLQELFDKDDSVTTRQYVNADEFLTFTMGRFVGLHPAAQHKRHTWEYQGQRFDRRIIHRCDCGAGMARAV